MAREVEFRVQDSDGNDHHYLVHLHPAEEGFDLLPDVLEVFAEAFGHGFDAFEESVRLATTGGDWTEGKINGAPIGLGLKALAQRLREKGGAQFMRRVIRYAIRDGKRFAYRDTDRGDEYYTFSAAYTGNLGELLHVAMRVINANYADFFVGLAREAVAATATKKTTA